jgi:hypothetical protein
MSDWADLFALLTADNGDNGDNGDTEGARSPPIVTNVTIVTVSEAEERGDDPNALTADNGDNGDNGNAKPLLAEPIVTNVTVVTCQRKEKQAAVSPLVASLAALERCRPDHIKAADWQHAIEDGRAFLVQWGEHAERLGWTEADVFGLPPVPADPHPTWSRLARLDQLGLIWLLHGRPVTAVTAEAITIEMPAGNLLKFYRPPNNGDDSLTLPTLRG